MKYLAPSWNPKYLEKVKWSAFLKLCKETESLSIDDELEVYELYKHLTGKTVASMERKLKNEEKDS